MENNQGFKSLDIWHKAMDITADIYVLVKKLPKEELFSLSNQMRRAAVSIPSNIAEGQDRNSDRDFAHFLTIARGSKAELETQLMICVKVGYLTDNDISQTLTQLAELGRMLSSFIRKLQAKFSRQ